MRYYDIKITKENGGEELLPRSLHGGRITSLLPNGQTNPAALNIEFDIPVSVFAAPNGFAYVRIWGLSLQEIGNAFDLNNALIEVRGGMQKGLPLPTKEFQSGQSGLLVKGYIYQAYGNWVGTSQTIDLVIAAKSGRPETPLNWVLQWKAGDSLASALKTTFDRAMPGLQQKITLSDRLVQSYDEVHYTATLEGLAVLARDRSKDIIQDANYPGVDIHIDGDTIYANDQSTPPEAKKIAPYDLIGQPTWVQPFTIQIKTVLRADLSLGDIISLPPTLFTTTQAAQSGIVDPKMNTTFNGNFVIQEIHHYGNFRQADGASWNTTINAYRQVVG